MVCYDTIIYLLYGSSCAASIGYRYYFFMRMFSCCHWRLTHHCQFIVLKKSHILHRKQCPYKSMEQQSKGDHTPESWQDDMSYPTMAQDVLHFLKEQDLSKVVLVAHSMGGKVAQALALLHPDVVEGLVIIDMAPVEYGKEEPHWKAVTSILETLHSIPIATGDDEKTTKADVDKALRKVVPDPALRAFCLTNWDARNHQWAIPVDKIVQQLEVLAGFDLVAQSSSSTEQHQYHGDTFFIHGGQSKFVRHAHVETIQQFFPNHMLTTIRGAGHWVHAEAPDDTIALLKRYLDR